MPMPISSMMRRWNGPIGNRSSRLPEFTDVICSLPFISFVSGAAGLVAGFPAKYSVQSPLRGRVAVPVEGLIVRRDHHALGVEMVVKTLGAEFAADATVVDAAPGRGRIEAMMIVDPDDTGLDRGRHAMGARDVAGADRSRQPKRGIIGEA